MQLILASGSPRRRELLQKAGFTPSVRPPQDVDETPLPSETPDHLVERLSRMKANTISPTPDEVVLAADTIVVCNGNLLGKPTSRTDAEQTLRLLRDTPHEVYSGVTITNAQKAITKVHRSQIWMRPYTEEELQAYLDSGHPFDKAGSYGIQDSFTPVARLEGCFTSVMGLAMCQVVPILTKFGLMPTVSYSLAELCASPFPKIRYTPKA